MSTILFLGAAHHQVPPIRYALDQGHRVITCDYLADNPGHRLAHESHDVSTTDIDAVLRLARKCRIDAIVAYASDPAAPTQAYVAEQLGLPGNPYDAVEILSHKDRFRAFLAENGFNVPRAAAFDGPGEARDWLQETGTPAYIKPIDSSGSKGVTRLTAPDQLEAAFERALGYSRARRVIVEEEIARVGYQVAGDGFVVDGRLAFRCWADEHFDVLCNGLVPIGESFPTSHGDDRLAMAHAETQRMLDLLGMRRGALNFDFVFDEAGVLYFLELGPRNGGCLIPDVIRYCTGTDLIAYTVDAALGLDCAALEQRPTEGFWSSYMVHALEDGHFDRLWLSEHVQRCIVEQNVWARPGDRVSRFVGSNDTLGTMILRYSSWEEMLEMMDSMENHVRVVTR